MPKMLRPPLFVDQLIILLFWTVLALLITGGIHFETNRVKLELSQIDPFTIPLMLLILWRVKSNSPTSKDVLPRSISRIWTQFLTLLEKRPVSAVWAFFVIYVLVYTLLQVVRYDSFHSSAFDLSYVDQSIWSTVNGARFLHSDMSRGGTYLGEHFSPILALPSVFYLFWNSIYVIFFFQSLLLGSTALLIYHLAKIKKISNSNAALLSLCALLYHPLRAANAFDLREDNFFVPIFLSIFIFWEKRNWFFFWFFCALSFLVKENAPLFTFMLGCWMLLRDKNKTNGCVLIFLSLIIFWLINSKITPHFAGPQNQTMLVRRLSHFGSTNSEIITTLLAKPYLAALEIFRVFLSKESIHYLLAVLLPFAVVARRSKAPFLIACAGVGLNLVMSANKIGFHYECILIPFLFYALIELFERLKLNDSKLFLILLSFLLFFGRSPVDDIRRLWPTDRDRWVALELKKIPTDASVATHSVLHPHLSHRKSITMITPQTDADYIVADLAPHRSRYGNDDLEKHLASLDPAKYKKIVDQDSFLVWNRVNKTLNSSH